VLHTQQSSGQFPIVSPHDALQLPLPQVSVAQGSPQPASTLQVESPGAQTSFEAHSSATTSTSQARLPSHAAEAPVQ